MAKEGHDASKRELIDTGTDKESDDQGWAIYKFAAKPKFVGRVEARTEAEAIARAAAGSNVPEHERFRLTARRD